MNGNSTDNPEPIVGKRGNDMAKNIEKTQKTKEKLINAFWDLYCENKIEKITVKAVTDKAGYYRSTFYEYFSDVYEVLEEIESNLLKKHRFVFEEIFDTKDFSLIKGIAFEFCEENAEALAILLGPNGDPKFYAAAKEHILRCLREVLQVDSSSKEIQITLEIVSGAIISVLTYWYQHRDLMELQELFDIVLKIFEHGAISILEDLKISIL